MRGWTKKDSSLRTHLMLLYVLLAVLNGVIVPALVGHLSLSGFQDYLGRRRTSDLEELGRSLAGQERLRKRLMTDIAHELRTPLTVVRSQVEAVADGVWEATPERLALCVAEIKRLSDLIGEVESLTRLEGEILSVYLQDTDLSAFLATILDSSEPLFARSGVTLHRSLEGNVRANVDSERFRSVIDNLLSNALRYSEAGGRVEVRLRSWDGSAVIEVEDTGAGIDAADLPHVFDRFYRADAARARVTGGRGIGLAIAKAAVEAHGGTIGVSSRLGEGSRFTVKLPKY